MAVIEAKNDKPIPSLNDYDEDTQAILQEMHKEGFQVEVPGLDVGTTPATTPPAAPAPAPAPATPVATPPAATPDDEAPAYGAPTEPVVPQAGTPPSDAPVGTPPGQTPPAAPVGRQAGKEDYWREKARDTETALAAAKAEIAKYQERDAFAHIDEKIDKVAKENNVSAKVIKEILTLGQDAFIPPELKQAMLDIQTERASSIEWNNKFSQFDVEFQRGVVPVLKAENPNITQKEINDVYRTLGGKDANGLAWADEHAETPLVSLYFTLVKPTQARASGEPTRVRSRAPGVAGQPQGGPKPLADMTQEELANMSDEDFDTYSEGLRTVQPKLQK